tara:strand:+ start:171 stop:311 length:141 start_codon:yes stop_codon:yes gene_type:complete
MKSLQEKNLDNYADKQGRLCEEDIRMHYKSGDKVAEKAIDQKSGDG